MSNVSLIGRIESAYDAYSQGNLELSQFADDLSECIAALEGVPYDETRELESIVDSLRVASYYAAEGFEFKRDADELIRALRHRLNC